jgi:hypothetical protein
MVHGRGVDDPGNGARLVSGLAPTRTERATESSLICWEPITGGIPSGGIARRVFAGRQLCGGEVGVTSAMSAKHGVGGADGRAAENDGDHSDAVAPYGDETGDGERCEHPVGSIVGDQGVAGGDEDGERGDHADDGDGDAVESIGEAAGRSEARR